MVRPTFRAQVRALDVEGAGPHDDLLQDYPERIRVALLGAAAGVVRGAAVAVLVRLLLESQQLGRGPQLS